MVRNTNETKNVTETIKSVRNEVFDFVLSGKMRKQFEEELSFDLYELLNCDNTVINRSTIENGINSITELISYYEGYGKYGFLEYFRNNRKCELWSSYVKFADKLYENINDWGFLFQKKYFTCDFWGYDLVEKKIKRIVRQIDEKNPHHFSDNDNSIIIFEFERPISFDQFTTLMDFLEGEFSRLWLFSFVSKKYKEKFFNLLLSEVTKYIEKSFENFLLYSSKIIDSNNTNEINLFLYKYPNCFLSDDDLNSCILKTFNSHWDINYNKTIQGFVTSDFASNLTVSETKHIEDLLLDFLVKNNKTLRKDKSFQKELENRNL